MRDKDTELRRHGRFDLPGALSRDDGKRCKSARIVDLLSRTTIKLSPATSEIK